MQERNALFKELIGLGLYSNGSLAEITEGEVKINPTDARIDVDAKRSLARLLKGDGPAQQAATGLINAINARQLGGIYGDSMRASVKYAKGHKTNWWSMIAKGEDGCLVLNPGDLINGVPIIIFRSQQNAAPFDGIRRIPSRLDAAIKKAWQSYERLKRGEFYSLKKTNYSGYSTVASRHYSKFSDTTPGGQVPRNIYPSDGVYMAGNPGGKFKNGELTLFGNFMWNPTISAEKEKALLIAKKWHPSIYDYEAATGIPVNSVVQNFEAILGEIESCPSKSVSRFNFFTHANKNVLGISGTIDEEDVNFANMESADSLNGYTDSGKTFTPDKNSKKSFSLSDVRDRLAPDAKIVLYGCKVGGNKKILESLFNVFQRTIIGFETEIVVCPPQQKTKYFNRIGTKIGVNGPSFVCPDSATTDWRNLINHSAAIRVP